MRTMFLHSLKVMTLLIILSGASTAVACPNCKLANETESNRPKAYMYSILFMIGMPATIFTGFGIGFYRMARNAQRLASEDAAAAEASGAEPTASDNDA